MKILLISDSHLYEDYLSKVVDKYKNRVDYIIHCGDSSLSKNDPLLKTIDIVVLGNHDIIDLPKYAIFNNIFVTHGHLYDVYRDYNQLIKICKENNYTVCLHGHTHVSTHLIHEGIHFINPGSLMMNRGSYGYGTYAILDICDSFNVTFYNHITHEICPQSILDEGLDLLEQFKKLCK